LESNKFPTLNINQVIYKIVFASTIYCTTKTKTCYYVYFYKGFFFNLGYMKVLQISVLYTSLTISMISSRKLPFYQIISFLPWRTQFSISPFLQCGTNIIYSVVVIIVRSSCKWKISKAVYLHNLQHLQFYIIGLALYIWVGIILQI